MTGGPTVIGFICDWSVELKPLVSNGRLRDLPNVRIIRVPCSGFVRPGWLEDAITRGADGAFVTGCPYGDCLNREGNFLMRDRLEQLVRRLQRRKIDPARIAMLAHGLHDRRAFLDEVRAFVERVAGLGPTKPAKVSATPAAASAGAQEGETS